MNPLITTAILLIGAVGLFLTFTKPNYDEIQLIREEVASYDGAIAQAEEFEVLKNKLLEEANTYDPAIRARLERMIPLNVDNVRLLIEIDSIADGHGLSVSDVGFENETTAPEEGAPEQGPEIVPGPETASPVPTIRTRGADYQAVVMTFSVDASYENFKSFIEDLEKSLRLVDIQSISSGSSESGLATYQVAFKTYWLGN